MDPHTIEDLTTGARAAWRHSLRCIGRLHWKRLLVHDKRSVCRADDVFEAVLEHLAISTNGGRIRPLITVFAADTDAERGPRIWNEQLIRYAGYAGPDGVVGDPASESFTRALRALGWRSPPPGPFNLLPLVIETPRDGARFYELPRSAVLEVEIVHPTLPWFSELGLRWYALPAISGMRLELERATYPCAPFSGWYMGTEIGARNFGDADRYDVLPEVGARLGLDTSSERTLWRDRALVELNVAVLHSFDRAGVTMSDHHTESRRFIRHIDVEARRGRTVDADWSWIVPPMSGSLTPVFHRYYPTVERTPAFAWNPRLEIDAVARRFCPAAHGPDASAREEHPTRVHPS